MKQPEQMPLTTWELLSSVVNFLWSLFQPILVTGLVDWLRATFHR